MAKLGKEKGLRQAYESGDPEAVIRFLDAHRTDSVYKDLWDRIQRTPDRVLEYAGDYLDKNFSYSKHEATRYGQKPRDALMDTRGGKLIEADRTPDFDCETRRNTLSNSDIKEKIRESVTRMSDEELNREYEAILTGAQFLIGSLKGNKEVRGVEGNTNLVTHYAAYTNALDAYRFTKRCLQRGEPKKIKVKENSRDSGIVDVKDVFLDSVRRITILEEYAGRN